MDEILDEKFVIALVKYLINFETCVTNFKILFVWVGFFTFAENLN